MSANESRPTAGAASEDPTSISATSNSCRRSHFTPALLTEARDLVARARDLADTAADRLDAAERERHRTEVALLVALVTAVVVLLVVIA